jgi:hypothetical protein
LFEPDVAENEVRTLRIEGSPDGLFDDDYGLTEWFCIQPGCDCRRVSLGVVSRQARRLEMMICHAFEGGDLSPDGKRTYIDPLHPPPAWAQDMLETVLDVFARDPDYEARLERHYRLTRAALADPHHPCHARLAETEPPPLRMRPGTIGSKQDPVMLRVPDEATAQRMLAVAEDAGFHVIVEIDARRPADVSDFDHIGKIRQAPAHLSRAERRAWAKRQRSRRR